MRRCISVFFVIFLLVSCIPDTGVSVQGVLVGSSEPPVLLEVQSVDEKTVRLVFNEKVEICEDSFKPFNAVSDGFGIVVDLEDEIKPGKMVNLSGRVRDEFGNTSGFTTPVWGYNPNLAGMLINELCTKTEPKTEILVVSDGNTAGAVLYNGVPENNSGKAILPSIDVRTGDFIVIWWTSEVVKSYGNDVLADTESKGYSNNGIQTLAVSPAQGARVIDCVVYSNGSSTFSGYGSSETEKRVKIAVDKGWWKDMNVPVDSVKSTKLRTMFRVLSHDDTDSASDWFIAENGGATFGAENTSGVYSE